MNREKYEDFILRFAKELHEVGVTENTKKIIEDRFTRTPNISGVGHEEVTDKFVYSHGGYMIEALRTVKLTVKKCK